MAKEIKLKSRKNKYGYYEWQCHICKEWHYRRSTLHYASMAKREVMQKGLGEIIKTPHLDFYLENTKEVVTVSRVWTINFDK